jgi:hypothetical protein
MIVSYRHRFVFLHAGKTGGSSVALALYPHLGPDDIILGTHQHARHHHLRPNRRTLRAALHPRIAGLLLKETLRAGDWGEGVNRAVKTYFRRFHGLSGTHASVEEVMRFMGPQWNAFHRFAFARNPWDWMVSIYHWHHRRLDKATWPTFEEFVRSTWDDVRAGRPAGRNFLDARAMFFRNGVQVVDSIGRFENLEGSLQDICGRIGLGADIRLPMVNKNRLRPPHDYRRHYTARTREMVDDIFAVVFADNTSALGYEF